MDINDVLQAINERYFAAIIGGHLRYFEDRFPLQGMNDQAMTFTLAPNTVQIPNNTGFRNEPAFKHWKVWRERRFYPDGFVLDANVEGHKERAYNLWQGYGVVPEKGDITPFKQHLELVEPAAREYVWKWLCWVVQNPADKPKVALVLRGEEGVGKGFIGQALVRLFGEHAMQLTQRRHVTGNFNAHLRHICLLFADEADFTGGDGEGVLKTLITEETMSIEAKGIDVRQERSHVAMFMSTNHDWAIPAGLGARRFVVADISNERKRDSEYFGALFGWLEGEGASHLLAAALAEDLSDWHPEKDRVVTSALAEQKINSLKGLNKVLFNLLWEGNAPSEIPTSWFVSEAVKEGEKQNVPMLLSHRLRKSGWKKTRRPGWQPPASLAEAREALFPGTAWPEGGDQWLRYDSFTDEVPF
ncbi:primase-helicase family protein [Altererythrobacter lutimaris]|uniref:NrS-1 polymerase-like helicase domain-containing protein n=1 Tax=Altererythrobacter lutimaris TaxID=2743979 RepID=A0A850HF60_9SPHN|nr:primase-helicase family protein [Altererythrobacter lutimaris]NVE95891.1 hypothetical protein [Altererythrobacter lutimaris]